MTTLADIFKKKITVIRKIEVRNVDFSEHDYLLQDYNCTITPKQLAASLNNVLQIYVNSGCSMYSTFEDMVQLRHRHFINGRDDSDGEFEVRLQDILNYIYSGDSQ